ncbi:MAG: HAMP domain-containing histidine kinase [Bacteroidaceae bacterium]|jgi:signal transduction histidine kinase|nr:HAMP domain-containing histidine kinase [Bacteroidaceae bacterium]
MGRIKEIKHIRTILIVVAVIIAISSLLVSHSLVRDLEREERNKMEVFAEAYRTFNNADENTDLSLVLEVISSNNTIPVVILDKNDNITSYLNLEIPKQDTLRYLKQYVDAMRGNGNSIRLYHEDGNQDSYTEVCYGESVLINRLTIFPYIQLGVVLIFVLIAIFALLSFKKTEQNRVWVGLSKETAHQLGTPISSLIAWIELLKDKYSDALILEMEKDVNRLQMIAERFSKIGSMPAPVQEDMVMVLDRVVAYMERRTPNSVQFVKNFPDPPLNAAVNASLFEWVIENLCKNAVDAMDGQGTLTINLFREGDVVAIEVTDTGKGISKNLYKSVFNPGFTTKKRGWGLGLSLAKRIVEEYHNGKIYVKKSEPGNGTTFRIELK